MPYNYIDDNYISQKMMGHQRLRKDLYCILGNVLEITFFLLCRNILLGSDIIAQKYTQTEAYKLFKQHNLEPLEPYINCKTKMKCLNNNGYIIDISLGDVNQNKSGKLFSKNNRFVLDNIKKYIHDDTNGDYEYVCGKFKNAYSVFGIIHKKCGRVFHSKWCNIYKGK